MSCAVEKFGRANLIDVIPATSDTLATICYTSVSCIQSITFVVCYSRDPTGNFRCPQRY